MRPNAWARVVDVSHELNTLTALRGYLETHSMPDLTINPATRHRYLGIVMEETHRLDLELVGLTSPDQAEERAWQLRALVDGLSVRFLSDPAPQLGQYRRLCLDGLYRLLNLDESAGLPAQHPDQPTLNPPA